MATERAPQRTPNGDLELQADETVGIKVQNASLVIRGKDAGDVLPMLASTHPFGVSASGSDEALQDSEDAPDDETMAELKFIPDDSSCLPRLFAIVSEMAALHPDPDAGDLDGDEEELFDEATLRRQGWEFVENEEDNSANGSNEGEMDA